MGFAAKEKQPQGKQRVNIFSYYFLKTVKH
jgi:hypothetical protein